MGNLTNELNGEDKITVQTIALEVAYSKTEINKAFKLRTTIAPIADADYTLATDENLYGHLTLTNGSWLSAHNIITNLTERSIFIDNTSGTYDATIKTASGSGILVVAGTSTVLRCDSTNIIRDDKFYSKIEIDELESNTAKTNVAQTFTTSQRGAVTTDNDLSFNLAVTNNFKCTTTATGVLNFTSLVDGQGGRIIFDNSSGHVITKNAIILADSTFLDTISASGIYMIGYENDATNVFINTTKALT